MCVAAIFAVRVAPAHDEPRSGPNKSERESTSGRSTKYASAHLIRAFRNIGRISSLLFLLSHLSPVGHPPRPRVQKRKTQYGFVEGQNGFNCVSCGTHRAFSQNEDPARAVSRGFRCLTLRLRSGRESMFCAPILHSFGIDSLIGPTMRLTADVRAVVVRSFL
jgi:hypothetical protein